MRNQTVPCKLCGQPTIMLGTGLCDRCWELKRRIEADPELARLILWGYAQKKITARVRSWARAEKRKR